MSGASPSGQWIAESLDVLVEPGADFLGGGFVGKGFGHLTQFFVSAIAFEQVISLHAVEKGNL